MSKRNLSRPSTAKQMASERNFMKYRLRGCIATLTDAIKSGFYGERTPELTEARNILDNVAGK